MNTATIRRVATRGLVSAALFVAQISAFTQVASGAQGHDQLAQFCAPPDQEPGAPRFYCQNERG
jgi:hypothetical protein